MEDSSTVLQKLVTLIRNAGRHMSMARSSNDIDRFLEKVEAAKSEIEKLIEYVKQHEKEISVTLSRSKVKEASRLLQRTLSIIEKAVYTLPRYVDKEYIIKDIQLARSFLNEIR